MSDSIKFEFYYSLIGKLGEKIGYFAASIVVAIISFVVLYFIGKILCIALIKFLDKVSEKIGIIHDSNVIKNITKPLKHMFTWTAALISILLIGGMIEFKALVYMIYRIGMIVFITEGIIYASDGIFSVLANRNKDVNKADNGTLLIFASKIVRFIVIMLSVLIILSEFGIDVNGIIAGLGLGGVTFALAAKDTASNIFGGVNIIVDKPFSVGDWIATSTVEGVVEDITFRSTRVRTFFDSVVVIPNNTLANDNITNWSKMNKRKDSFVIGVTYNTPKDKLEKLIEEIRIFIENHNNIIEDTVIVRLEGFGASSIDIYGVYFMDQTSFVETKRIREEINFGIMDIMEKLEIEFAFPSRTIYMAKEN